MQLYSILFNNELYFINTCFFCPVVIHLFLSKGDNRHAQFCFCQDEIFFEAFERLSARMNMPADSSI